MNKKIIQKISTPQGFTEIENIRVGDFVHSKDGKKTKVQKIIETTNADIYKVQLKPDIEVHLHSKQMLFVEKSSWRWSQKSGFRKMLFESFKDSIPNKQKWNRFYSPVNDSIRMKKKDLFIHPYIMGILLGDGGLTCSGSVKFTTVDEQILKEVETRLPEGHMLTKNGESITYSIVYPGERMANPLKLRMTDLNLMQKSSLQKHIPEEYLHGSIKCRFDLLCGLMDSDGTVSPDGREKSFCTSSELLAKDFVHLCRSLGATISTGEKRPFYYSADRERIYCETAYNMQVKLPFDVVPFKLQRKIDRCNQRTENNISGKYYNPSYIYEESTYVGKQNYIELCTESGSYIGDNFFVHCSPNQ